MMKFINGFTLDATKGSMARFVNHSCDPNCEIRQMQVRSGEGKKASVEPRMALFAVDYIKFGDELTYDYNFEYVVAVVAREPVLMRFPETSTKRTSRSASAAPTTAEGSSVPGRQRNAQRTRKRRRRRRRRRPPRRGRATKSLRERVRSFVVAGGCCQLFGGTLPLG